MIVFFLFLTVINYDTGDTLLEIHSDVPFASPQECIKEGVKVATGLSDFYRTTWNIENASTNIVCKDAQIHPGSG